MDAVARFKETQREGWANFAPAEVLTIPPAARLVNHARLAPGMRVLDVGCGTGVVAITAARLGCRVSGIDLTPRLLERARENAGIAEAEVDWREGDVEQLPYGEAEFDAVLSQFAHIFAPRPEVALAEMLRVLRPGGILAFSTWPPGDLVGRTIGLGRRYMPGSTPEFPSPMLWGDRSVVAQRLGSAATDIAFDSGHMLVPTLSLQHFRKNIERTAGPIAKIVEVISQNDPQRLQAFRDEFESIVAEYFEANVVRQEYLLTRSNKSV